jgi:hypothetical protein
MTTTLTWTNHGTEKWRVNRTQIWHLVFFGAEGLDKVTGIYGQDIGRRRGWPGQSNFTSLVFGLYRAEFRYYSGSSCALFLRGNSLKALWRYNLIAVGEDINEASLSNYSHSNPSQTPLQRTSALPNFLPSASSRVRPQVKDKGLCAELQQMSLES